MSHPPAESQLFSRREVLTAASIVSSGLLCGSSLPIWNKAWADTNHEQDWAWLTGTWDVWHRRLKERLANSNDWEEFGGKSTLWSTLGGLGNVDDNIIDIPSGSYRGVTARAFDPSTNKWSIWWLDGRDPTRMDPPVVGAFNQGNGEFIGRDTFKGTPILMRFRWNDVHSKRPWWEQAFSTDEGKTWEVNWRNYFTRTSKEARPQPKLAGAPHDSDFLAGTWNVRHKQLVDDSNWQTFDGTLVNRSILGGYGHVSDTTLNSPDGAVHILSLESFDPKSKQWSAWCIDSRHPSMAVKAQSKWNMSNANKVTLERSSSNDDGKTWRLTGVSELTRP